jgi:hypothetical protein
MMPIIPENDPNGAYDVIPMDEHPRGPRGGGWTVTCTAFPPITSRQIGAT